MVAINQVVDLTRAGDIAVITINSPPVNALSASVRQGVLEAVNQAAADPLAKAIVLICAGRTFIAGADISEFGRPPQSPSLNDMMDAIEDCAKSVVAAIHGTALGGGLETALVCHYRVAVPSAKVGLPEIKLGILPGARRHAAPAAPRRRREGARRDLVGRALRRDEGARNGGSSTRWPRMAIFPSGAIAFAQKAVDEQWPLQKVRDRNDKVRRHRGKPEIFEAAEGERANNIRGFEAWKKIDRMSARRRRTAVRRRHGNRARQFHAIGDQPAIAGAASRVFRRTAGQQDRRHRRTIRRSSHQEGRRHRRRHDGRRHRDEFPQRRHSGRHRRNQQAGAGARRRHHPRATTRTPPRRAACGRTTSRRAWAC